MRKIPVSAAAAALLFVGLAQAVDLPPIKEGLWSMHMITIDNPGNVKTEHTQKICRNHAYDEHAHALSKNMKGCRVFNEKLSGGVYSVESECSVAGEVIRTKGTTTSQGDTAFRTESHNTYTPVFHGVAETTMIIEQKYVGSCPAGVQPGDRVAEDGRVTHTGRP